MTGVEGEEDKPLADVPAEQAVLGACLSNPDAVPEVSRVLGEEDFFRPPHQTVWATLKHQWELGYPTDPVSVGAALEQQKKLLHIGGAPYLHTLYESASPGGSVGYWADLVAGWAARRRMVQAAQRITQLAEKSPDDVADIQTLVRDVVDKATARVVDDDDEGVWVADYVDEHVAEWDRPVDVGVRSPWLDVNEVLGGLRPGQLATVAGRPGSGKSTAVKDWAVCAAQEGASVLFVSLEMSRGEMVDRMISAEATVRLSSIRHRTMDQDEKYKALRSVDAVRKLPLRIEDRFVSTLAGVRAKARDQARSDAGLDLLVVDHIGLLRPTDARRSRNEQVADFSRGFKLLAKELSIPVMIVSQLNRAVESRQDKVPVLSDLRDSGGVEEDSDIVFLVYRPDYYDRESPRSGEADLILAKNRNGPTATITVAHQLHYSRFRDIARGFG